MTVLEIKNQMSRLKSREIKELHTHMVRLRHGTAEWKKATAKKLRAVEAGRFITAEEIEERLGRG
jgi:predicted transcriptional regulator